MTRRIGSMHVGSLPGPWANDGACVGAPVDLWTAPRQHRGRPYRRPADDPNAEAKAVCARCPVAADCLAHAIAHDEPWAIWGGMTPTERHHHRRTVR